MTALELAQTGHLILGTVHAGSSIETIDRILVSFQSGQSDQIDYMRKSLASVLHLIIYQELDVISLDDGMRAFFEVLVCNVGVKQAIKDGRFGEIKSLMQMGKSEGMQMIEEARLGHHSF